MFTEILLDAVRGPCGIEADGRILVAVSGGADSVCLLHALRALGQPCVVAHVNHGLRGNESEDDAAFVQALSTELGAECRQCTVDPAKRAAESGDSIEMAARTLRYDALAEIAALEDTSAIATAHHAGDQAETVLMRIIRGASPRALAGIPARGDWKGTPLIRPMLALSREQVLAYLEEHSLKYREDSSNTDPAMVRNRLRHDLLPRLEEAYNPGVRDALTRLATIQSIESDYLDAECKRFGTTCLRDAETIDRAGFSSGHPALQHRLIAELLRAREADIHHDAVAAAARFVRGGGTGMSFDAGSGVLLQNGRTTTRVDPNRPTADGGSTVQLHENEIRCGFGRQFRLRKLERIPDDPSSWCSPERQILDAAKLDSEIVVRQTREGDRFRPLGMGGSKTVSDWFSERGIPRWERRQQLVVESGGAILWLVGGAVDERAATNPNTKDAFEIQVIHETK